MLDASAKLRAISVAQPWASLIARGVKTLEVRSWMVEYRGPLVIHASKNVPADRAKDLAWAKEHYPGDYPLGCVVAIADLVECRHPCKSSDAQQSLMAALGEDLSPEDWLWCLANIRPCEPVKSAGALRVWEIDPALVRVLPGEARAPAPIPDPALVPKAEKVDKSWQRWMHKAEGTEKNEQAEAIYRKGLAKLPESAPLTQGFAFWLWGQGRLDEAETMFRLAVKLAPEDSNQAGALGSFLLEGRRAYAEAECVLRKALEENAYDAMLTLHLAAALRQLPSQQQEASRLYERALTLVRGPQIFDVVDEVVDYHVTVTKDLDRAEELRRQMVRISDGDPAMLTQLADFLTEHRGNPAEADQLRCQVRKEDVEEDSSTKVALLGIQREERYLYLIQGTSVYRIAEPGHQGAGKKQIIQRGCFKREPGFLYYLDSNGDISRTVLVRANQRRDEEGDDPDEGLLVLDSPSELFDEVLPETLLRHAEAARTLGGTYAFKLGGRGGGAWTVDLSAVTPSVRKGAKADADCLFQLPVSKFLMLIRSPILAQRQGFLEASYTIGSLKVAGDDKDAIKKLELLLSLPAKIDAGEFDEDPRLRALSVDWPLARLFLAGLVDREDADATAPQSRVLHQPLPEPCMRRMGYQRRAFEWTLPEGARPTPLLVAIHAAETGEDGQEAIEEAAQQLDALGRILPAADPGHIVALAELTSCEEDDEGTWTWTVERVRPVRPVRSQGKGRLWRVPSEAALELSRPNLR